MVAPTITGAFPTIADNPEQTGTFQIQFIDTNLLKFGNLLVTFHSISIYIAGICRSED